MCVRAVAWLKHFHNCVKRIHCFFSRSQFKVEVLHINFPLFVSAAWRSAFGWHDDDECSIIQRNSCILISSIFWIVRIETSHRPLFVLSIICLFICLNVCVSVSTRNWKIFLCFRLLFLRFWMGEIKCAACDKWCEARYFVYFSVLGLVLINLLLCSTFTRNATGWCWANRKKKKLKCKYERQQIVIINKMMKSSSS